MESNGNNNHPTSQPEAPQQPQPAPGSQPGRIRRGWAMATSAWRVFRLDKELTTLPLIGLVVSIVALLPFGVIYFGSISGFSPGTAAELSSDGLGNWSIPFWLAFYFVMTIIGNFFGGAVIHGAMTRFRGGDPTVKGSIAAVARRFRPLVLFSLLMSTVGLALQLLEERVPFAGKIAVWLVDAAWNIANFFALPIIVMGDTNIQPLQATKQSVQMVRKIWGESVVAQVGISLITFLATMVYTLLGGMLTAGLVAANLVNGWTFVSLIVLLVLGLLAIALIASVLGGIVKAALYHYATTGIAPETFNKDLLRSAMTAKKARKIFG